SSYPGRQGDRSTCDGLAQAVAIGSTIVARIDAYLSDNDRKASIVVAGDRGGANHQKARRNRLAFPCGGATANFCASSEPAPEPDACAVVQDQTRLCAALELEADSLCPPDIDPRTQSNRRTGDSLHVHFRSRAAVGDDQRKA